LTLLYYWLLLYREEEVWEEEREKEVGEVVRDTTLGGALPMVTSKFRPNIALPTLIPILLMQPLQHHVYYIYITKFR
jgi:hypothetical protein